MTALKTLSLGVLIGLTTSSIARGDSVSSTTTWVYYGGDGSSIYSLRTQYPSLFAARNFSGFGSSTSRSTGGNTASSSTTTVAAPVTTPTLAPITTTYSAPSVAASLRTTSTSSTVSPEAVATTSPSHADAYVNLGTSVAPAASQLTTGTGQPWYDSPSVMKVYGGNVPNADQQASFSSMVLNDVKQTFSASGLNPSITNDPNVPANHTLSVLSNTSFPSNPNAIGITNVGESGFSFIDKLSYASTPQELALALAKNISHELMHAFGVGTHPDTTGNYIDTSVASWSLLTNPNSTFSPDAVSLISKTGYGANGNGSSGAQLIEGEQEIAAVPEPTTIALWSVGGLLGWVAQKRNGNRSRNQSGSTV